MITQIPGGYLAGEKIVSSKWLFGCGILITSVFTVLMPLAANINYYLLLAVRVIEGNSFNVLKRQRRTFTSKIV